MTWFGIDAVLHLSYGAALEVTAIAFMSTRPGVVSVSPSAAMVEMREGAR